MHKEKLFFHYGHFRRPFEVTQGDNGASKKSIGHEPKIHLCGVIPNKLKHGGLGHRPSPLDSFVPVSVFSVFVSWSLLDCSCFLGSFWSRSDLPELVFVVSPTHAFLPPKPRA